MAKVSVIMPVYNAKQTLERCLDALCSQTYKDFEVICVDDGSKDSSLDILNKYNKKDSRIVVLSLNKNFGPAKARNYAISKSTGKYLMFCDADDWYEPEMIETMVKTIEEQNVDVVMCDCEIHDLSNGKIQNENNKKYHYLKLSGYYDLSVENLQKINIILWNKIFKKEIIDQYRIDYPINYELDDLVYCYKYFIFSNNYYGINKKLYNYVVGNANSIMGKVYTKTNTKNRFDFIYAYYDLYEFIKKNNVGKELIDFYINENFIKIKNLYKLLELKDRKEAFKITKRFINNNSIVLGNNNFSYISKCRRFEYFDTLLTRGIKNNISLWEEILSVKNEGPNKVLRLFGLKFKFRNTKLQQREDLKNIMKAINDQSKITKELVKKTDELLIAVKEIESNK